MKEYNLPFISDEDLYKHVMSTVCQYRSSIDLASFQKNIVDPIKLTFDSKIYGLSVEELIRNECLRQIDKSNSNYIGYFHQNIFRYFDDAWEVLPQGYDIVNRERNIFVELKNKHNTMNSASAQRTYRKMQKTILENDQATCILGEVIAKKSQNIPWNISLDGKPISNKHIRRVSIDTLYEIATGDSAAFYKLCSVLPQVLDDVTRNLHKESIQNTVFDELTQESADILQNLYRLSFSTYGGFSKELQ